MLQNVPIILKCTLVQQGNGHYFWNTASGGFISIGAGCMDNLSLHALPNKAIPETGLQTP